MRLNDSSCIALREYLETFCKIHQGSVSQARVMLVGTFTAAYGMFSPQDRLLILQALLMLVRDIGGEVFEDGQDFLSHMLEKTENLAEKRENGEE